MSSDGRDVDRSNGDSACSTRQAQTRLRDRIANGDLDALRIAYDRYGALVYGLAGQRCAHDQRRAEELTRATFPHLWTWPWRQHHRPLAVSLLVELLDELGPHDYPDN